MATAVALATVFSVIGAYSRAPHALLGVAFARACAAERVATERTLPRLRVDDEDVVHDADTETALLPSSDGLKVRAPREPAEQPPAVPTTLPLRGSSAHHARLERDPGIERVPIGAPTRERARLMVFLN